MGTSLYIFFSTQRMLRILSILKPSIGEQIDVTRLIRNAPWRAGSNDSQKDGQQWWGASSASSANTSSQYCKSLTHINVYSVGWAHQGCKYTQNAADLTKELEHRLWFRYKDKLPKMDLYISASCFHRDPPWSGHCGLYDDDIQHVVQHHRFERWLTKVREEVESFETRGRKLCGRLGRR